MIESCSSVRFDTFLSPRDPFEWFGSFPLTNIAADRGPLTYCSSTAVGSKVRTVTECFSTFRDRIAKIIRNHSKRNKAIERAEIGGSRDADE